MSRMLVAGLGNDMRGDDAAGLLAVRALGETGARGVDVLEDPPDTLTLAAAIADHAEVLLIDAVALGCEAGRVFVLDEEVLAKRCNVSGHGVSPREAVGLARAVGHEPIVHVIGITGSDFSVGAPPSEAVVRAAQEVARWIREMCACA